MAELVLTPEEKAAQNWFEFDDATIGKMVKFAGAQLIDGANQKEMMLTMAATYILINSTLDQKSDQLQIKIYNHSLQGIESGDWILTVQKVDPVNSSIE